MKMKYLFSFCLSLTLEYHLMDLAYIYWIYTHVSLEDANINDIVVFTLSCRYSSLVYKKIIDFCTLILHPTTIL